MKPIKFDEEHAAKCKELKKLLDKHFTGDLHYTRWLDAGCYVRARIGDGAFGEHTLKIQFSDQAVIIEFCLRRYSTGFVITGSYVGYPDSMQGYEKSYPDMVEYFYKSLTILIQDLPIDMVVPQRLVVKEPWFESVIKHTDHLNICCINERDVPNLTKLLKKYNKKIKAKFIKICDSESKEVSDGSHIVEFVQQIEQCPDITIVSSDQNKLSAILQHLPSNISKGNT
jgi:hypothetical protein